MISRREALLALIAEQRKMVAGHEAKLDEARVRLADLERELSKLEESAPPPITLALPFGQGPVPETVEDKIALFRRFFRGREDVFPRLWENQRTGKKGYAPACDNEWVPGVCAKPRVKCGECPSRAFAAVTDQVIADHLRGKHVVGVYPMLTDETCWLLALDFDKAAWREDVAAFVETCHSMTVPHLVERSRSGEGAHVWVFFTRPVPAVIARKMGCYLLTETMSRRHQLSMTSYDRLFPNQDTMPAGGFGNLIALPLQKEARERGNTVFLDGNLAPIADDLQWAHLAGVERIDPFVVDGLAMEATRQGRVVGVRMAAFHDEADPEPWSRPPSGRPRPKRLDGPLPRAVSAVRAQQIFIDKVDLPSALITAMKRLAAFQNPEFYKKQAMRLSTAMTPRVIQCFAEDELRLALPRGCLEELEELLGGNGIELHMRDERCEGEPLDVTFNGVLTDTQEAAVDALLAHDIGVFVAPPGIGKTVVGVQLIAKRGRNTLVLVHRQPLLDQWRNQLALFLGWDLKQIGQIGAGKDKANGRLDVAMIQSLVHKGVVKDLVARYGHVVVDECHHVPAFSFERVLAEIKGRYITGLTATPYRRDGHHPISEMQLGPVRFAVDPKKQAGERPFEHKLLLRETSFRLDGDEEPKIQELYTRLASDDARNDLILNDVIAALEEGRSPILLTERRDHLEHFEAKLRSFARNLIVLAGGMGAKQRKAIAQRFREIPDNEERLVLATGRYIGEGFDDARLDTLFLALPVSWKGTLVQYAGRLHRLHPGKSEVQIYDYVDRHVPMLARMFERRLRGYRAIGYTPDSTAENTLVEPIAMIIDPAFD
ncbi:MAG: DEAD/DEAH box helicase family protein [Deltaproteobacteria bacterium]|nr:DEAD/DEAH box helicase family protein [Deltaproteobacteria bacterium]